MARSFSPWSHVVSMLFPQLTHAVGLDVCDALRLHSGPLGLARCDCSLLKPRRKAREQMTKLMAEQIWTQSPNRYG
jgi:hypothetical protein